MLGTRDSSVTPCISQVIIATLSHFLSLRHKAAQIYRIHGRTPGVIVDVETVLIDIVIQFSDSSRVTPSDFMELARLYAVLEASCGESRMYIASLNNYQNIVQKLQVPRDSMMSMLEECSKTCM
jgi:hypothetical protein